MIEQQTQPTKFTPLQHELLRLYSHNISEEDLIAIKNLIGNYFADKLQKKITKAAKDKGYTAQDFEAILNDPGQ